MNQTKNYQLNKWEKTDRIQMEDFNNDNDKIDAALHEAVQQMAQTAAELSAAVTAETEAREAAVNTLTEKTSLHTLVDATCSTSGGSWNVDISSINWSQWKTVYITVEPKTNSGTSCRLLANGSTTVINTLPGNCTLMLTPLMNASSAFSGVLVSGANSTTFYFTLSNTTVQAVKSLSLMGTTGDYQVLPGSTVKVLGIK